jgi:hypothetical protein
MREGPEIQPAIFLTFLKIKKQGILNLKANTYGKMTWCFDTVF